MPATPSAHYVVLGAGIVGLATALELHDKHPSAKITIVAEFLPGDDSPDYCSIWASAMLHWLQTGGEDAEKLLSMSEHRTLVNAQSCLEWERANYNKIVAYAKLDNSPVKPIEDTVRLTSGIFECIAKASNRCTTRSRTNKLAEQTTQPSNKEQPG